jgi:signal recognition particle subunit SRP54
MFDSLADKLQAAFKKLTGKGRLSEEDVAIACREIRLALLEADVNFRVVKDFTSRIQEKATGKEILESLTPGQQVVKIVHEELVNLLSGEGLLLTADPKQIKDIATADLFMLVGLQGGGKTTTSAKLASWLRSKKRKPLLVATDLRRPAAVDQLAAVGAQVKTPVFLPQGRTDPVEVVKAALAYAQENGLSPVVIDTQGRTHVDDELMEELKHMRAALPAAEVLLVVDAMTGQEAVKVGEAFNTALNISGFILTKLDGDARGGAALSLRSVVGKPIKFIGTAEKLDGLELFHADRMASRILGMGDVLTLIEKAEEAITEKEAKALEEKIRRRSFDLNDFLEQSQRIAKMGSLENLLGMIPGMGGLRKQLQGNEIDQKALGRTMAIIQSMTPKERADPDIIKASRRKRIAHGSGTSVQDVNVLLSQFKQMKQMLAQFSDKKGLGRGFRLPGW